MAINIILKSTTEDDYVEALHSLTGRIRQKLNLSGNVTCETAAIILGAHVLAKSTQAIADQMRELIFTRAREKEETKNDQTNPG